VAKKTHQGRATYHIYKKSNIIGKNIREFRKKAGLSQEQLAWACYRRSRSYISSIENGHNLPSLCMLCDLASILKIPPSYLLIDSSGGDDNFLLLYKDLKPQHKTEVKRYMRELKRKDKYYKGSQDK